MKLRRNLTAAMLAALLALFGVACNGATEDTGGTGDTGTETEADTGTDTEADTGTDTEADTEATETES